MSEKLQERLVDAVCQAVTTAIPDVLQEWDLNSIAEKRFPEFGKGKSPKSQEPLSTTEAFLETVDPELLKLVEEILESSSPDEVGTGDTWTEAVREEKGKPELLDVSVAQANTSHSIREKTTSKETLTKMMSATEVAEFLHIHKATVYRKAKKGLIPFITIGDVMKFDLQAVSAAL